MKLILLSAATAVGLALPLSAQQAPPATQNPDTTTAQPQPEVDTAMQRRSAQSFEGKITRSGEKLVLRENASKIAYQLDDQEKARKFEGRDVKVMGTVEAPNNMLHIVDIMAIETNQRRATPNLFVARHGLSFSSVKKRRKNAHAPSLKLNIYRVPCSAICAV